MITSRRACTCLSSPRHVIFHAHGAAALEQDPVRQGMGHRAARCRRFSAGLR